MEQKKCDERTIATRVPAEWRAQLIARAKAEDRTISAILRRALIQAGVVEAGGAEAAQPQEVQDAA